MKKVISIISLIVIVIISTTIYAANIPVTGIKVDSNNITIEIGQTEKIKVTFSPGNATNKNINWSSSNYNIVSINSSGEIKGISAGVATVKGITVDGGYTVTITVSVSGQSSITTEKYSVVKKANSLNEEVKYINKIDKKTTVNQFTQNVTTYTSMDFYNLANEKMGNLDYIVSGTKLKLGDGSEYILVVSGDVNSDGNVSIVDLSRLKLNIVGLCTLDDGQMEGADINFDGKVSITDLAALKLNIVGLKPIV